MIELKTFAIRVYSAPHIAEACLTLQNEHAADVPLLLFCGWYGAHAGPIPAVVLAQAKVLSQRMGDNLIYPLRQTRRWMKSEADDAPWQTLRDAIKHNELEAELMLLQKLQQLSGVLQQAHTRPSVADVMGNMLSCVPAPAALPPQRYAQLQGIAEACLSFVDAHLASA